MSESLSYVLPILRTGNEDVDELTDYLTWLSSRAEVIVVDASPPPLFADAHRRWSRFATHIAPCGHTLNGKVAGVHTGIAAATNENVVIADDDVRYEAADLSAVGSALWEADLARPQNYFAPLPWHGAWDTSRSLLHRCLGSDSPGTLGVRRSVFMAMGGYDGDVMYENLELIRTVQAAGGRVADLDGVYVRRLPPTIAHFWSQRPRQAYDDFSQPWKFIAFLAVLPGLMAAGANRCRLLAIGSVLSVTLAERGRRSNGGSAYFPRRTSLWAPVWVAERSVMAWVALWLRATGGVMYRGKRIPTAAHSRRELLRRRAASSTAGVAAVTDWSQA